MFHADIVLIPELHQKALRYNLLYINTAGGAKPKRKKCERPLCGGKPVKRSRPYVEFFGFSNYRATGRGFKENMPQGTAAVEMFLKHIS